MYSLFDYVTWRGDLDFGKAPLGDLDALALSAICYLKLPEACKTPEGLTLEEAARSLSLPENTDRPLMVKRTRLFRAMARCSRFASLRLSQHVDILDTAHQIQFSAVCCDLPGGLRAVCFRGTDATLVGWREDFAMCYDTVPAQLTASAYLTAVARGHERMLLPLGHSKGGNLAWYASATVEEDVRRRIPLVWCFDAPGLSGEVQAGPGARAIRDRIRAFIPQTAIIGLLMGQPDRYTVVASSAAGLAQHDTFTWKIQPPAAFETAPGTSFSSRVMDKSLDDFLRNASPEQRRQFVDAVFKVLESTGATTLAEMKADFVSRLPQILQSIGEIDPQTRQMLIHLAGRFLAVTATTTLDLGLSGTVAQASAMLKKLLTPTAGGNDHDTDDQNA